MSQQKEATPDEQAIDGVDETPQENEPIAMEDALRDPEPEPVEPDPTAEATPPVEQPGPDGGAEGTGEEDLDNVEIERLDDGRYKLGKYVSEDPLELAKQVERARRHAEHLVGKKREELAAEQRNPFVDEDVDEIDESDEAPYTEAELASTFGKEIAQGLIEAGVVGQQQQGGYDQQLMQQQAHMQALEYADTVIAHPEATGEHFRAALQHLVQAAPHDEQGRQRVLDAWGMVEPVAAAQEAARIEFAKMQVWQQQQAEQQRQQAEQAMLAEQQQFEAQSDEQQAFVDAQRAFVERNPDWQQLDADMTAWMQANRPLMARAKGDRAAVYSVFQAAYDYAAAKRATQPPAGEAPVVSEHGAVMGPVSDTEAPTVDPRATARQHVAQQRDMAGLETGAAIDDVAVNLTNPNPAGLAETPIEDLLGVKIVR